MKLRISILLIFFALSEAALAVAPSTLFVYLKRIRTSETYEVYRVRIGFIYDSADALSEGENSDASLSTPFLSDPVIQSVVVSQRDNRAEFIFDLPLSNITDVNGNWNLLINSGSTPDEALSFTIVGIDLTDFGNYPAFPEINYNDTYNDVFFTGGTIQSGWISWTEIEGGAVYRYPDGGPYRVRNYNSRRNVGSFPLLNGIGQTVMNIKFDYLDSISRIHFFVSPTPISLNSRIDIGKNDGNVTFNGMKPNAEYILEKSGNLTQWNLIDQFTSQSNTLILDLNEPQSKEFFRITEVP